jgi:hypothetical protein
MDVIWKVATEVAPKVVTWLLGFFKRKPPAPNVVTQHQWAGDHANQLQIGNIQSGSVMAGERPTSNG